MTREMSRRAFYAALKRNGFKHSAFWYFNDTTGQVPHVSWPGVVLVGARGAVTICYRDTLAKLINARSAELKHQQKERRK